MRKNNTGMIMQILPWWADCVPLQPAKFMCTVAFAQLR
jgi:hypothetical protein